jgi:hypothetical protein
VLVLAVLVLVWRYRVSNQDARALALA